jgi:hypothetical protein
MKASAPGNPVGVKFYLAFILDDFVPGSKEYFTSFNGSVTYP